MIFLRKYLNILLLQQILIILGFDQTLAQNKNYSVGIIVNYTTGSKIFLYPGSQDYVIRNSYFATGSFYSPSFEFRYEVFEKIYAELNIEYSTSGSFGKNLTVLNSEGTATIEVKDGFKVIPIELIIGYEMPFSYTKLKFYMSGGIGYYYGEHTREFGDFNGINLNRNFAVGIIAGVSMEYFPILDYSISFGMKFRSPELDVVTGYSKYEGNYKGTAISIKQNSFVSRINIDGITFNLLLRKYF